MMSRRKPNNLGVDGQAKAALAVTKNTQKAVDCSGLAVIRRSLCPVWMRDAKINDIDEGTHQPADRRRLLEHCPQPLDPSLKLRAMSRDGPHTQEGDSRG
jgi:hypothetical protein